MKRLLSLSAVMFFCHALGCAGVPAVQAKTFATTKRAAQPVVIAEPISAAELPRDLDKGNDEWVCKNNICTLSPEARSKYGEEKLPTTSEKREESMKQLQAEMDSAIKRAAHKTSKQRHSKKKKAAPTCSCKQ